MLQYGQRRVRYRRWSNPGKPGKDIVLGTEQTRSNSTQPWTTWRTVKTSSVHPGVHGGQATADELHSGPPYRSGGKFKSIVVDFPGYGQVFGKTVITHVDGNDRILIGFTPPSNLLYWGGDFGFTWPSDTTLDLGSSNGLFPSMSNWGAKGWQKAKPQLEKASGFVFGAELRELPQMLGTSAKGFADAWHDVKSAITGSTSFESRVMRPKAAADQFLNEQFGWAPFLRDVAKFDDVLSHQWKYIKDITDKNNKAVRKRVTLLNEETVTPITGGGGIANSVSYAMPGYPLSIPAGYFKSPPFWRCDEVKTTKITAVGKFRYYRKEFDATEKDYSSSWNEAMRQATLYGLRISPSNLWKITPWGWAVDWFTSANIYIDNWSDYYVDNISAEYFFVMQHQRKARRLTCVFPFHSGLVTLSWDRFVETKQRLPGSSPFDFDLAWNGLSDRQIAIAAALGISRW